MTNQTPAWRRWLLLLMLPTAAMAVFWLTSAGLEGPGFPLDDAWIHQTYARNLAESGQWAFQPGQPSGGSTSPLWTLLLLPGTWIGFDPAVWSGLLGWLTLLAITLVARAWLASAGGVGGWQLGLVAGAIGLEWHLVWAALSGMETLLAGLTVLLFLWLLLERKAPPYLLGIIIGAGIWIRPDLLSLLLTAGWFWLFQFRSSEQRWRWPLQLGLGIVALFLPYVLFQWSLTGTLWPTTIYAKQAEYAALRSLPWLSRFAQQWVAPLAGPLVLLLPAILYWTWRRTKAELWEQLAPILWVIIYLATFATRLPVTYQHGRYAMPTMPVLIVIGLIGLNKLVQPAGDRRRLRWMVERVWVGALAVIALAFILLGARAYQRDVAIIETEMVDMARWISQNTEPSSLVAAHDIGALGYFGERALLDMAGLVSPRVIGFLRDEASLAEYLEDQAVDYLMTFPDWYPQLVTDLGLIHSTGAEYSPAAGGSNMTLYAWP